MELRQIIINTASAEVKITAVFGEMTDPNPATTLIKYSDLKKPQRLLIDDVIKIAKAAKKEAKALVLPNKIK